MDTQQYIVQRQIVLSISQNFRSALAWTQHNVIAHALCAGDSHGSHRSIQSSASEVLGQIVGQSCKIGVRVQQELSWSRGCRLQAVCIWWCSANCSGGLLWITGDYRRVGLWAARSGLRGACCGPGAQGCGLRTAQYGGAVGRVSRALWNDDTWAVCCRPVAVVKCAINAQMGATNRARGGTKYSDAQAHGSGTTRGPSPRRRGSTPGGEAMRRTSDVKPWQVWMSTSGHPTRQNHQSQEPSPKP